MITDSPSIHYGNVTCAYLTKEVCWGNWCQNKMCPPKVVMVKAQWIRFLLLSKIVSISIDDIVIPVESIANVTVRLSVDHITFLNLPDSDFHIHWCRSKNYQGYYSKKSAISWENFGISKVQEIVLRCHPHALQFNGRWFPRISFM